MEFSRYADHECLRKKGIAAATLEALEKKLKSLGTEFIYVHTNWKEWPKSSEVIPAEYCSETLMNNVIATFPKSYSVRKESFKDYGFFKLTDAKRNATEGEYATTIQK